MRKKQYILMMFLAFIGGLIGGALSSRVFMDKQAFAQNENKRKIIEANEFRVVDTNGEVKATFGMSKLFPSLRLLTKAYGSDSGILIQASEISSMVRMYGENAGISMDVFSLPSGTGRSTIEVESRPTFDFRAKEPKEIDSSRVEIKSGVGFPTKIELFDKDNNHRAILGHVTLVEQDTGITKEYPTSLVFFDKKGITTWKAP